MIAETERLQVRAGWLVEVLDECTCAGGDVLGGHEDYCGYEPLINIKGMTPAEKVAVVLDHTAALGTPEVVYRRKHGESIGDAAKRLRAEVMLKAENVLRVVETPLYGQIVFSHAAIDMMPVGTVLLDREGNAWKRGTGSWVGTGGDCVEPYEAAPLTVIWLPADRKWFT